MKAIGYIRVSTERQADQGVSLGAQMAKVKAMATVQGLDLADVVVDGGESAKSLRRPGIQQILGMVEKGEVKAIIVAKLDRPAVSKTCAASWSCSKKRGSRSFLWRNPWIPPQPPAASSSPSWAR